MPSNGGGGAPGVDRGGYGRGRACPCMNRSVPAGAVRPFGDRAFLIGVDDPGDGSRPLAGVRSRARGRAVPRAGRCIRHGAGGPACPDLDPGAVEAWLKDRAGERRSDIDAGVMRTWRVPCLFDGPDLDEVATRAGCATNRSSPARRRRVTRRRRRLFPGLRLPQWSARRAAHRAPAGPPSSGRGGGFGGPGRRSCAVYPTASPGGWQLVGRTAFSFFQRDAPPYATLAPGDAVRLAWPGSGGSGRATGAGAADLAHGAGHPAGSRIVVPGVRAVLQDGGQATVRPPSACPTQVRPMPTSFVLANRLGGQPRRGRCTVEMLLGAARWAASSPVTSPWSVAGRSCGSTAWRCRMAGAAAASWAAARRRVVASRRYARMLPSPAV